MGSPGQARETAAQTLALAKRLSLDIAQSLRLMVYPGTAAYEWARQRGCLATEDFPEWLAPEGMHPTVGTDPASWLAN